MPCQSRQRHVPQLDLFRPDLAKVEWHQLPAEVRGKARRADGVHAARAESTQSGRRLGRRAR